MFLPQLNTFNHHFAENPKYDFSAFDMSVCLSVSMYLSMYGSMYLSIYASIYINFMRLTPWHGSPFLISEMEL